VQEAGDCIGGDEDSSSLKKIGDFTGGSATPFEPGDRVASGVVLQQDFDGVDYLRRFFSTGLRPAPARRIRPN
jgi:hypothetical protein